MPEYKILLIFAFFTGKGGVAIFCRILLENLSSDFRTDYLLVGNRHGNSFIKKLFNLAHTAYKLITKLRNSNYDIIHINPSFKIHSLLRDSFYLLIIKKLGYGKRTVVFFHGWDDSLAKRVIRSSFYKSVFRKIYKEVGIIFVLCNQHKEHLANIGIELKKIKVTTTMYQRVGEIKEYSSKKTNEKVNILFMSRFVKDKGVYIAAEVGRILVANDIKNFQFIFAGDGPEYKNLKNYISRYGLKDYIAIPGFITGEKKQEILNNSDIFLFPTYYGEGCPLVILEAMGAGLVVVSTPVAAIPDIVKHDENGFIVNSTDPIVFYEAVKRLLDDRELLNRMQKVNKKKAEENYDAVTYTERMEKVYLSIIDE